MKTKNSSGISPAALSALCAGDLENFLVASTPGGIEAQEKYGQLEQAAKQTLPCDMRNYRKDLEALGFKFGKIVDGIFIEAEFPKGWCKRPTDHSMWSDLVDEKGRKRGGIFYKAAFYDRSANVHLSQRFCVRRDYDAKPARVYIADECGIVHKEVTNLEVPEWSGPSAEAEKHQAAIEAATAELQAWLKAEYPQHESPLAYWT